MKKFYEKIPGRETRNKMGVMQKYFIFILIAASLFLFYGCEGDIIMEQGEPLVSFNNADMTKIKRLTQKSFYFGHQSVGSNILNGIQDLEKETKDLCFTIGETNNVSELTTPFFAHLRVGKNTDPVSKIDDFKDSFDKGMSGKVDIAFLKLCYIDINFNTDAEQLFTYYKKTMKELKNKYPDVLFVHFTVPLTTPVKNVVAGLKRFIKGVMGKHSWDFDDNIMRNKYNELITKEYEGREPVFDLARIESSYMDGRRTKHSKGKEEFYTLVPEYTDDGGHLNEEGRKVVAGELLVFLAGLE